ncbi:MAG: carbon starvation CstA family protein, partial [Victivallales bacterium]|jgi:carbon starvation protein
VTKFIDGSGLVFAGPLFPFCFITIACGAISGFHALISSGTTPKMITSESCVRTIGYGAMVVEMMVAIMALIAASTMNPGVYLSINMKGEPAAVVQKASAAGFPVTEQEMKSLAENLGEKTMFGRTGGAPTFAVGMAEMLAKIFGGRTAMALWYHFAIMFEALFILTTIDAGTRVGRFLMQDLLGQISPELGHTGTLHSNITASVIFVGAWGWFLFQGVIDPLGGINSLWPIFGIANQLLAVIALSLGTTIMIKMGKARYILVTLLPLLFLFTVTMTAGFMKIFSADPRLGFLSNASQLAQKIAEGGTVKQIIEWETLKLNNYINAAACVLFMGLVILIVAACVREWYLLLSGKKEPVLHESDYVTVEAEPGF